MTKKTTYFSACRITSDSNDFAVGNRLCNAGIKRGGTDAGVCGSGGSHRNLFRIYMG